MALGALYPAAPLVRWALRLRRDRRPAILDVGTGSGSWYGHDCFKYVEHVH